MRIFDNACVFIVSVVGGGEQGEKSRAVQMCTHEIREHGDEMSARVMRLHLLLSMTSY